MKKYILLLAGLSFFAACDSDEYRYNNRYLPNYNFSADLNLEMPLYNQLRYPSNAVYVNQAGIGINGVIVANTGSGYVAFEASCPNQALSDCSMLTFSGMIATCPCDEVKFSLYDGSGMTPVEFQLKPYKVVQTSPTMLKVYN